MAAEGQQRVRPPRAAVTACVLCTAGRGAGQGVMTLHNVIKLGILDALMYVSIILIN